MDAPARTVNTATAHAVLKLMAKGLKQGSQATFDFADPASPTEDIVPPYPGPRLPPAPASEALVPPVSPKEGPGSLVVEDRSCPARATPAPTPPAPTATTATASPMAREVGPLTVAGLGRLVERTLNDKFEIPVVVTGEAIGVRFAQSGHLYFTLKDEDADASIDVVVYRTNVTPRSRAQVRDGAKLLLRGKPTYYSPRGRLQFVADKVGLSGKGALLEALEKRKAMLAAEGLFREDRKRKWPSDPRVIGVVTSRSGAVIHDICRVAFRRGGAQILLAPAVVQGPTAPAAICRAIRDLERVPEVDVIIVARGGGSTDDLSAFNEVDVVRAVAACRVPVVSAVGHEVDVTLVDFAADARASTPSQAAELVVPDARARASLLVERRRSLVRAMHGRVESGRLALVSLGRKLGDPRTLVATSQQRLDERRARILAAMQKTFSTTERATRALAARVVAQNPRIVLANEREALAAVASRMARVGARDVASRRTDLARLSSRLDAMSPLKVLGRGYAIVTTSDGHAVRNVTEVATGDRVHVRVAEGSFEAEVQPRVEETKAREP